MELRAIQAVQLSKPGATRRTNGVSEAWLDPKLAAQRAEDGAAQDESHREADESVEDAEELKVIEVPDLEGDERPRAAQNHVDVLV